MGTPQPSDVETTNPEVDEDWLGRTIDGRYRIVERIGEGGMGAVYAAQHLKLNKRVAVKIIRAELARDPVIQARFTREATATARLDHPHVASAIDYGSLPDGSAYLVMQLVRGSSLRRLLQERGQLPWREAVAIGAQIADALAAAHGRGIVHRDLKPENVIVERRDDGSPTAKVLDFGIARMVGEGVITPAGSKGGALTRVGTILGTPGYMAPEQALGMPVDETVDLYALGVLLFEAISGRFPFPFSRDDVATLFSHQLEKDPPRLSEVAPGAGVPAEIDAVVSELLAREPTKRAQKAGAIRDRLRAALAQDAVAASHGARLDGSGTHAVAGPARPVEALATIRGFAESLNPQTRRAVPWVAGALLLLALGIGLPLIAIGLWVGGDEAQLHKPLKPRAAKRRGSVAAPVARAPADLGAPSDLADQAAAMLEDESRDARRAAAQAVLDYARPEAIAPYLLIAAELEVARGCPERRDQIVRARELGDPRILLTLQRLAESPRRGCGVFGTSDCHACLRETVAEAIESIGGGAR